MDHILYPLRFPESVLITGFFSWKKTSLKNVTIRSKGTLAAESQAWKNQLYTSTMSARGVARLARRASTEGWVVYVWVCSRTIYSIFSGFATRWAGREKGEGEEQVCMTLLVWHKSENRCVIVFIIIPWHWFSLAPTEVHYIRLNE